jgi:hypothetical protein
MAPHSRPATSPATARSESFVVGWGGSVGRSACPFVAVLSVLLVLLALDVEDVEDVDEVLDVVVLLMVDVVLGFDVVEEGRVEEVRIDEGKVVELIMVCDMLGWDDMVIEGTGRNW